MQGLVEVTRVDQVTRESKQSKESRKSKQSEARRRKRRMAKAAMSQGQSRQCQALREDQSTRSEVFTCLGTPGG